MSILQRLYDSEINFEVSGFCDAGFDVRLGDAQGRIIRLLCGDSLYSGGAAR
jgi:hypothetical protein